MTDNTLTLFADVRSAAYDFATITDRIITMVRENGADPVMREKLQREFMIGDMARGLISRDLVPYLDKPTTDEERREMAMAMAIDALDRKGVNSKNPARRTQTQHDVWNASKSRWNWVNSKAFPKATRAAPEKTAEQVEQQAKASEGETIVPKVVEVPTAPEFEDVEQAREWVMCLVQAIDLTVKAQGDKHIPEGIRKILDKTARDLAKQLKM